MTQVEQEIPTSLSGKQALSVSTSSSDHNGELALLSDSQKLAENVKNEEVVISPEEEEALKKEIEKAFEARKEYLIKECKSAKKRLDLDCNKIDDLDAYTISMCLSEKEPTLEIIHLGTNSLTDEGLRVLTLGLQHHVKLRELYLGNNKCGYDVGIHELIEILPRFTNLQILSLGNIGLADEKGVELISILEQFKNLKSLMLNTNIFSDGSFIAISQLLCQNKLSCSTLHIGDNKPTSIGLIALFRSLEINNTLKNLYLNDTLIYDDASRAINRMLIKNSTLELLNIGNCGLDDESISLMKYGLMYNKSLKTLHLWNNRISNEGGHFLRTILEDYNDVLTGLLLSDNFIEEEDILNNIKRLLKRNEKLDQIEDMKNEALKTNQKVFDLKGEKCENEEESKKRLGKIDRLLREVTTVEKKIEEAKRELLAMKETQQA